jgi:hypothetical protein
MHEQGLVLGAQVMSNRAALRKAALQSQVVPVSSMCEDHDGAAQPGDIQQRCDLAENGAGSLCGGRIGEGEEPVE